jgi:hypothetical protein
MPMVARPIPGVRVSDKLAYVLEGAQNSSTHF